MEKSRSLNNQHNGLRVRPRYTPPTKRHPKEATETSRVVSTYFNECQHELDKRDEYVEPLLEELHLPFEIQDLCVALVELVGGDKLFSQQRVEWGLLQYQEDCFVCSRLGDHRPLELDLTAWLD